MKRKLLLPILLVLLSLFFVANPARAAKSYFAEYFDVEIDLQEGGSAIVTETVRLHFEGDPFTFAFREISLTETDGVRFLDASNSVTTAARRPAGTAFAVAACDCSFWICQRGATLVRLSGAKCAVRIKS